MIEDRTAIWNALHLFYSHADHGRYEDAAALFLPDGELTFGLGAPKPGTLKGPQILDALSARRVNGHPVQRHSASNVMIDNDGDNAAAKSLLTIYRFEQGPTAALIADVEQVWKRHQGEWKLAGMRILPVQPS